MKNQKRPELVKIQPAVSPECRRQLQALMDARHWPMRLILEEAVQQMYSQEIKGGANGKLRARA